MKKVIVVLILVLFVLAASGCKKNEDILLPVRISFLNINPQVITGNETAFICISVSNLEGDAVLVKTLVDQGITNPSITYTTGNPLYIEYFPPAMDEGTELEVIVTIIVANYEGKELDRADGRVYVNY